MSNDKKSFLLHIDSLDVLDELTDEEAGMLFKAMNCYQRGEDLHLEGLVRIAFSPFKNQFMRDDEKYDLTCKRRAEAGSKGGKQKVANASKGKQKVANLADSVSKNKNKNKSDSKNDSDKDTKSLNPKALPLEYSLWDSKPSDNVLKEWLAHRKNKKATTSQLVITKMAKEINAAFKLGYSADDCLSEAIERNWQGFKSEWIRNSGAQKTALHDVANKVYYEGDL